MYAKINQKTSNFLQTMRATYKKVDSIFFYNFCYILNKTWTVAAVVAGGHTVVAKPKEIVRAVWQIGLLFAGAVRWKWDCCSLFAVRWNWGCCSLVPFWKWSCCALGFSEWRCVEGAAKEYMGQWIIHGPMKVKWTWA